MNSGELRRLLIVVLPAAAAIALAVILVATVLGTGGAGEPTGPGRGAPRIGRHHWHATYQVFICGERQPNFPTWESGVHTHGDGVIHIHPFVPAEEGKGARLVKFFEYGGGKLTQSEMRMPGDRQTFRNGDKCPDGSEAVLQVIVNGEPLDDLNRYVPQDGDRIRIVFGPPEAAPAPMEVPPAETPTPPGR